jgi:DNA-binding GntR family transcriptional regulator
MARVSRSARPRRINKPRPRPDAGRPVAVGPRLTDTAYAAIKRDILECVLFPGMEMTERQLGVRYGIGKAPLREALVRLSHEAIVQSIPRSGYRVTPVTIQDVQEVFALRLLLEPTAARQAAGRTDERLLRQLNKACLAGYKPGERGSESAFLRANREFHVAIANVTGNRRLARVLEDLLEQTERLFHLGLAVRDRTEEMTREHETLIMALMKGDADAAARVTVDQINAARTMVMDGILAAPWFKETSISQW